MCSSGQSSSGRALEPSSCGAMKIWYSSTRPLRAKAPARRGPASTSTSLAPPAASPVSSRGRSTWPLPRGRACSSWPAAWYSAARPSSSQQATSAGPAWKKAAVSGTRSWPSISTRSGGRTAASAACSASTPSSSARTVRRALSNSTVSAPVTITLERARRRCTAARAAGPVIHWLSPLAMAVRPSRLIASLTRTYGRPRSMRLMKPTFSSRASPSSTPQVTAMPAARNRSRPRPATCGLGSCIAATTRPTPALTSASAHGGVRP
ncbi:hypothetical protein D3C84_553990 [compost metagenome]